MGGVISLTNEAAGSIFKDCGCWFGSPALLRKPPAQFSLDPSNLYEELTYIIDGSIRFGAIVSQHLPVGNQWLTGQIPFLVYTSENIYSTDGRKLLPRMLTLAGHYDRAALHLPEHWSASPLDIAAFLGVTELEAHLVFVELKKANTRRYLRDYRRENHRYIKDNRKVVEHIRIGLALAANGESDFSLEDVARLVGWTGPV